VFPGHHFQGAETPTQVRRVYDDIDQERHSTACRHAAPLLLEKVSELDAFRLS
jgi:hypothetical protein